MKAEAFSLSHVDPMIDFLEKHIAAGTDTPAMLDALQQRLDGIDARFQNHPEFDACYPRMLELQALIHGRRNEDDKALTFMKEAVRATGGVSKLRSPSIRQYIAAQTSASAPQVQPQLAEMPVASLEQNVTAIAPRKRKFFGLSKLKVGFASAFAVLAVGGAVFAFVPQAAGLPVLLAHYSEVSSDKKVFDDLTAQYKSCSSKLNSERGNVNTYDTGAVSAYNTATKNCEEVLAQQNQAANRYDSLVADK